VSNKLAEERTDLAQDRTDWAEDRTVLANERTYAGWMRTALASMALGLGFHAIFGKLEPIWLGKGVATAFGVIGLIIIVAAFRQSRRVLERLSSHAAEPLPSTQMALVSALFFAAGTAMIAVLWLL
jgi:putative membrane protein